MISFNLGLSPDGDIRVRINDDDADKEFEFHAPIDEIEQMAANLLEACETARAHPILKGKAQ